MARKKSKDKVFNDRSRKIFRHYFGASELAFGVFFILFTVAMGAWFVMQRDNYDPGERDISMELMIAQQAKLSYFLLRGYERRPCRSPLSAKNTDKLYPWTWDNLKNLVKRYG